MIAKTALLSSLPQPGAAAMRIYSQWI